MMKKSVFISLLLLFLSYNTSVASIPEKVHTVIANPGEDATTCIRLNWHSPIDGGGSCCRFTTADDSLWINAQRIEATQELCLTFDSIYSKSPGNKDIYEDARFLRNTVELNGLRPNTHYIYTIDSDSTIREFKTAPTSNEWTAGIISDFHAYTPLPDRVKSAMTMIDTLQSTSNRMIDLMLHVGDITAWGGSYSFWEDLYNHEPFQRYLWAGVNGNHDNMSRGYAKQSNDFFRLVNNYPLNGYTEEKGVCYYFTYGNTLFIMLNNESMRSDEGLSRAQEWVRNVIALHSSKFIIVMQHYQWFFATNGKASQYDRWKELFDQCGVDLAIAANNHVYARTGTLYDGAETDGSIGTVYIQTPSSDNERGQALQEWTDNKDIIKCRWSEGPHTIGAMLLNASDSNLNLTLYDRHGHIIDTTTIRAKR